MYLHSHKGKLNWKQTSALYIYSQRYTNEQVPIHASYSSPLTQYLT